MTTQGLLHTCSPLTFTIIHPSCYSYGDYDLTRGTIIVTYKYSIVHVFLQLYTALNGHDLHLSFSSRYHLHSHTLTFPSLHASPFFLRWSFSSFMTFLSFCRACGAPSFACTQILPYAPFPGQQVLFPFLIKNLSGEDNTPS